MNAKQRRKKARVYVSYCQRVVAPILQEAADLVLLGKQDEAHRQLQEAVEGIRNLKGS